MKASYNWLKEFVDFNLPPQDLAHRLTMAGLEVDAIEKYEDDTVFEIGVTPNRPDCLSIRGIAREISALLDIPLKDVSSEIDRGEGEGPEVVIERPDICLRYAARIVRGVKPGPSPDWIVKRLESCGIRLTSNIVDITNYVLLELGQPMHAFDLDRLSGEKIIVTHAGDTATFTTLDEGERSLHQDMLMIRDGEKPVAVAGIMGGMNTEVTDGTANILLESAYFHPSSVRRTSRALSLSTESSYRFERGVDIEAVIPALDRAARLITEIAGGSVTGVTDVYPEPITPVKVSASFEKIRSLTGVDIPETFVEKTLNSLGFDLERTGEGITVTPPSFRNDIYGDVHIVEEIARLYGYDNIPATLPVMQMTAVPRHDMRELHMRLKNAFVTSGFSEVINYSFLNPDVLDTLNLSADDRRRNLVYIKNPLRKEESAMRTTLIPALLDNISMNLKRGEKVLRLFELSTVFLPSKHKLPDEVTQLAAAFHKGTVPDFWPRKHDGFYDVKGVCENIFSELKITNLSFSAAAVQNTPYLHPGKSCAVMIGDIPAGAIGALHPAVADSFDIRGDITVMEIYDTASILDAIPLKTVYAPAPRFPSVERDIALVVSNEVTVADVRREILGTDSDIIEAVTLFDIYRGKPVPDDKKSMAFSIRFRSAERTLTDSEVDDQHGRIMSRIKSHLNAELRS